MTQGIRSGVDVGAAAGEYTCFLALKTSARKVIAIDPHPEWRGVFTQNLAANNINEWKVERSFDYIGAGPGTRSLDSFLDRLEFPCFVKVDVDGSEVDVLRSALCLLGGHDVRWLIETHSSGLEDECIDLLSAAGYLTLVIENAWWRRLIPDQRPIEHNRWLAAWKKGSDLVPRRSRLASQ